ncbi:hypothetical protein V494_04056 [Pseudogymnoascus sp. VKM F-4513 (FW-928)]|nr:hypothetical protein V494_04056 [Pseudogymnoascus sp. VKM F-4513 (FW-928)]
MSQSSGSASILTSPGSTPGNIFEPLDGISDEAEEMRREYEEYMSSLFDAASQSSGSDAASMFSGRSQLSSPRSQASTAATSETQLSSPSSSSSSDSASSSSSDASSSTLESWSAFSSPPPSTPPPPPFSPGSLSPDYWSDDPSDPPSPSPNPPASTPEPPPPSHQRLVIAIAGPTSSGKTTLSNLLLHAFGNGGAAPGSGFTSLTIHQDDYLVPNNLPTGPQVQWVECFLEEWMDNRLVRRKCMRRGFTVDEADRITPLIEDRLIDEYRAANTRPRRAPGFNRESVDLQLRHGKNRDTRLIIHTEMLDIAIARARANMHIADLDESKRDEIKDYRFLLKKSKPDEPDIRESIEGPHNANPSVKDEVSIKEEQFADMEALSKKYKPINKGELTMKERAAEDLHPFHEDPTMPVASDKIGQRGYVVHPIKPNSLAPHHGFRAPINSVPYPGLPEGTRPLLPFITQLRAEVHHWIDAMAKLNDDVGFPGLNFIKGKFRGIAFVEGFTILEPAEPDEDAEPRNYDLTLFLSATRAGTRVRRFQRKEYKRPIRQRYMTWREFSYFDGVAWPAFIAEHQWIFKVTPEAAKEGLLPDANNENVSDLAKERGVHVRPGELNIKETLKWAVRTIMAQFEMKEKIARDKWVNENNVGRVVGPYEDWAKEFLIDEYNDGGAMVSHAAVPYIEWVQDYLMDENDLNMMFQTEKDRVEIQEATDLMTRHDPENWSVEPTEWCTCESSDDDDDESWCTCWEHEYENQPVGPGNVNDETEESHPGNVEAEAKVSHPGDLEADAEESHPGDLEADAEESRLWELEDGYDPDDPWWGMQDDNLVEEVYYEDVYMDDYDDEVDSDEYVDDGTEAAAFWASSDSESDSE